MNLQEILHDHKLWLEKRGGIRANLRGADLRGCDLREADLHKANLFGANLHDADLHDADLRDANLFGANFRGSNLHDADLRDANLRGADLRGANLRGADLRGADLSGADLSDAVTHIFCKWPISIKNNLIIIGCKKKTPPEWADWLESAEVYQTPRDSPEFPRIKAAILAAIAYVNSLNEPKTK